MIKIDTDDNSLVKKVFKDFVFPEKESHKGENGKILIIGGSSLFHSAPLWSAEVASYFADLVHFSSTEDNEKIFLSLKKKFRNGIIIKKEYLDDYIKEDDVILLGTGMLRKLKIEDEKLKIKNIDDLIKIKDEGEYTYFLTNYLIEEYPQKKFVIDAGSLQMMEKEWFLKLKISPIITPHQKEFEKLFNLRIVDLSIEKKAELAEKIAKDYNLVILLKSVFDIISNGKETYIVEGGNPGLTKGGTGDVLASLAGCFYIKNDSLYSALYSSILLKKTAEELFNEYGYWYNVTKIIENLPKVLKKILL